MWCSLVTATVVWHVIADPLLVQKFHRLWQRAKTTSVTMRHKGSLEPYHVRVVQCIHGIVTLFIGIISMNFTSKSAIGLESRGVSPCKHMTYMCLIHQWHILCFKMSSPIVWKLHNVHPLWKKAGLDKDVFKNYLTCFKLWSTSVRPLWVLFLIEI